MRPPAPAGFSTFRVGVSSIGRYTDDTWQSTSTTRSPGGHGVHVHFHEVREEVTAARQRTGRTAIGHAEATGMFQVPVIAAHSVWVDREDRERYATNGVGVAHNPVANGILASGIAPVAELRALGVPVGIGVDGPASNDSQDFLQAMKTAALFAPRPRPAGHGDERARGLRGGHDRRGPRAPDGERDRIAEPGKRADLVVFDGDGPTLANVHDPYQAVVFTAGSREVRDVWVDGELSVADFESRRSTCARRSPVPGRWPVGWSRRRASSASPRSPAHHWTTPSAPDGTSDGRRVRGEPPRPASASQLQDDPRAVAPCAGHADHHGAVLRLLGGTEHGVPVVDPTLEDRRLARAARALRHDESTNTPASSTTSSSVRSAGTLTVVPDSVSSASNADPGASTPSAASKRSTRTLPSGQCAAACSTASMSPRGPQQ